MNLQIPTHSATLEGRLCDGKGLSNYICTKLSTCPQGKSLEDSKSPPPFIFRLPLPATHTKNRVSRIENRVSSIENRVFFNQKRGYLRAKIKFFKKILTYFPTSSYENNKSKIELFFRIKSAGSSNYRGAAFWPLAKSRLFTNIADPPSFGRTN